MSRNEVPTVARLVSKHRELGQIRPDATTVLTAYAVLLYLVPSDRRIATLGGAGSLASLLATAALLWWGYSVVCFKRHQDMPILITNEPLLISNLGKLPIVVNIPSSMTYLRNIDYFSPML
jgi:hypothetical protein